MRIVHLKSEDREDLGGSYREFDKGEFVWIICNRCLAVKCRIEHIDDHFHKKSPSACLFYEVDEPIGHSLSEKELYLSREDVAEALDFIVHDDLTAAGEDGEAGVNEQMERYGYRTVTLESMRRDTVEFIVSTWRVDQLVPPRDPKVEVEEYLTKFPEKSDNDWFRADVDAIRRW